jgi:DNA polymerase-1
MSTAPVIEELRAAGLARGDLVALAIAPATGLGISWRSAPADGAPGDRAGDTAAAGIAAAERHLGDEPALALVAIVRAIEDELRPRWVWWSRETTDVLLASGLRVATCWDIAAVHRLLVGGWRADPARAWAGAHSLPLAGVPDQRAPDLFSHLDHDLGDPDEPVRPDGYLRPDWAGGDWDQGTERVVRWATLALEVATLQQGLLGDLHERPHAPATARSESAAELLCAEMSVDGLPVDRAIAERTIATFVGPRPRSEADAAAERDRRDAEVLRHAPADARFDLRSPGQVKSLLRRVGIEVPDTRAWRLKELRDVHPIVEALLAWRKAERVATTYGYAWLDEHLGPDGRLRGAWSGSDGAAGRMTASAGLHNMPADMRIAVVAEPGHVFVRADLGQIEPRVLAAVAGDGALAQATLEPDLYAPVADALGVDRATAKVAVLGAMYGQTTGHGATALRGLRAAYPVAMAYLEDADRAAQVGHDLRTDGGRRIAMGSTNTSGMTDRDARSRAAARGRYGRNAMVQGAAAELFKVWAVTVRARAAALDASIVLCLHDELLVHAPLAQAEETAALVDACLQEAATRWSRDTPVRFVADTSVIACWADAKD